MFISKANPSGHVTYCNTSIRIQPTSDVQKFKILGDNSLHVTGIKRFQGRGKAGLVSCSIRGVSNHGSIHTFARVESSPTRSTPGVYA